MELRGNLHGEVGDMLEGAVSGMIRTMSRDPITEALNVTANGTYIPPSGVDGFDEVNVSVPGPVLQLLNVDTNGTYTPPSGVDGYDEVNVFVPAAVLQTLNISTNGTYTPPSGVDGYNEVKVSVPEIKIVTSRTQVATSAGYYLPPQALDGSLTSGKNYYLSVYNQGANITVQNIFKYNGAGDYLVYFQAGTQYATLTLTDTTATFSNYPGSYRNIFIRLSEIDDSQILNS